jgi:hypothetical protein
MPSSSSSGSRRVVNTQACVVEDLQRRLKEAQNRSLGMPVKGQERSIVGVLGEFYRRRTANPNELTVPGLVGGCACARVAWCQRGALVSIMTIRQVHRRVGT